MAARAAPMRRGLKYIVAVLGQWKHSRRARGPYEKGTEIQNSIVGGQLLSAVPRARPL